MSYPKFSIGEPVLIYSGYHHDMQGVEATVIQREWWDAGLAINNLSGKALNKPGYYYRTDSDGIFEKGLISYWQESALRKRPSDFTFKELMERFKTPVPA